MLFSSNLSKLISTGTPEELRDYLAGLRNADFRTAGKLLGERRLWTEVPEERFWQYAATLVAANNKAYLGTMLKAAVAIHKVVPLTLDSEDFKTFAAACVTEIDRKKSIEALLPLLSAPQQVTDMQSLFSMQNIAPNLAANLFFHIGTAPAYYHLFKVLKQYEDQPAYIRRYGVELIRKGDKMSFNLASILQEYFSLGDLPGSFSLSIPPYELSRLDVSFESFKKILLR